MPSEWDEECHRQSDKAEKMLSEEGNGKPQGSSSLRPPLYNAEDYTGAMKKIFGAPVQYYNDIVSTFHLGEDSNGVSFAKTKASTQEMSMKKFLNGSELLFKLEADLRYSYPSFVHEFVSSPSDGVACVLEALKFIQNKLDDCSGIREQRKLIMDEMKCLQCIQLTLRNIEAVSKLSTNSGGLFPIVKAIVSTVTATRVIALEILCCVCTEGGADGHYKVSEGISTLRLRLGEPIRCKLLIGAISSAIPGTYQAQAIKFLTAWVSSAPSPKHKVHIQCELEEAGFNPAALRKTAELAGARESREVQRELDEWDRVSIDVDTLSRQNCQLRNSVATLQQELATLKDKLKRMDVPKKQEKRQSNKNSKIRKEEMVTTPVDSEEEAEQIHQILEDLNNIVNSEMGIEQGKSEGSEVGKKEKEIVPVHLVRSPPPKKPMNHSMVNGKHYKSPVVKPRPWPGSSASDDDDSDIIDVVESCHSDPKRNLGVKANVRKVVERLESLDQHEDHSKNKVFRQTHQKLQNLPIAMAKSVHPAPEPPPDYAIQRPITTNFHKGNPIANKFANFRSAKLLQTTCSSPDSNSSGSSRHNTSNSYAEVYDDKSNISSNGKSKFKFSPRLDEPRKPNWRFYRGDGRDHVPFGVKLRRSESVHASLSPSMPSLECAPPEFAYGQRENGHHVYQKGHKSSSPPNISQSKDKKNKSWKSMESLTSLERDENFTLRWRYPMPSKYTNGKFIMDSSTSASNATTPSPKNTSKMAKLAAKQQKNSELCSDYRQSRFVKKTNQNFLANVIPNHSRDSSSLQFLAKGKSNSKEGHSKSSKSSKPHLLNYRESKDKENVNKMLSLPPILMPHAAEMSYHRISDLPSGLY